nr:cyclic nucleotide-binding domain-containing protein [Lachnospiraceae bacterium]
GESILEAGHRTDHICLVVSGLVRGFYIDEEGNDRTKCFSLQGDWCCSEKSMGTVLIDLFLLA